jgi:hypothetical protein
MIGIFVLSVDVGGNEAGFEMRSEVNVERVTRRRTE